MVGDKCCDMSRWIRFYLLVLHSQVLTFPPVSAAANLSISQSESQKSSIQFQSDLLDAINHSDASHDHQHQPLLYCLTTCDRNCLEDKLRLVQQRYLHLYQLHPPQLHYLLPSIAAICSWTASSPPTSTARCLLIFFSPLLPQLQYVHGLLPLLSLLQYVCGLHFPLPPPLL